MDIESFIKNLMDIAFKTLTDSKFLIVVIMFMFTTMTLALGVLIIIARCLEATEALTSGTDKEIRKEKELNQEK